MIEEQIPYRKMRFGMYIPRSYNAGPGENFFHEHNSAHAGDPKPALQHRLYSVFTWDLYRNSAWRRQPTPLQEAQNYAHGKTAPPSPASQRSNVHVSKKNFLYGICVLSVHCTSMAVGWLAA